MNYRKSKAESETCIFLLAQYSTGGRLKLSQRNLSGSREKVDTKNIVLPRFYV